MKETINLDSELSEYFDFIVEGHTYRFRYPTIEEAGNLSNMAEDEEKTMAFIFSFINKVDDASPDFKDIYPKMIIPKQQKFVQMLKSELGNG